MPKFIGAMGATHTEYDKLVEIAKKAQKITDAKPELAYNIPVLSRFVDNKTIDGNIRVFNNVEYIGEEKIDGYSYLNSEGRFLSKSLSTAKGNEGAAIDKTEWMPHLASIMKKLYEWYGLDLQGELYIPGGTSDDVTKVLGCTQEEAVRRQRELGMMLHYKIIDVREFHGINVTNLPQYARRALIDYIATLLPYGEGLVTISEMSFNPLRDYKDIVSHGGEGMVFKNMNGIYVPGKKPANNWIKAKKSVTLDAFIMGFNDGGSGKNTDLFKSIRIGIMIENTDGDGFITQSEQYIGDVHSGISDALRLEMHNNRDGFIGRVIEVEAMDYNPVRYSCRHARLIRFRDDKNMYQCGTDGIKVCTDLI